MSPWDLLLDVLRTALFSLSHIYSGSLGFAIITLSVLVRLALLPMSLRAARRAFEMRSKMTALQPELTRLRKKHAADQRQLGVALRALYERNGIRPLQDSGIVAMLVQAPIGFALYSVIKQGIGAGSKFLWIGNLARADIMLSLVTAVLTAAMTLTTPAPGGAEPNRGLAVMFALVTFFMVWHIASGVTLYWASSTSVSVVQNLILRHERSRAGAS